MVLHKFLHFSTKTSVFKYFSCIFLQNTAKIEVLIKFSFIFILLNVLIIHSIF